VHPRVARSIGVHGWATTVDGVGAQLVVPGLIGVDLAQTVLGSVLGQPRHGVPLPNVDRVALHVRGRVWRRHPSGGLLGRAILGDGLAEQLILVLGGTPTAGDGELDPVVGGVGRGLANCVEQIGIELGHSWHLVVKDRHAVSDVAVRPEHTTIVVARAVDGRLSLIWAQVIRGRGGLPRGRGPCGRIRCDRRRRGRRGRGHRRLVAEDSKSHGDDHRDGDCKSDEEGPLGTGTAGCRWCWFAGGHAFSKRGLVLPVRMRISIHRRYVAASSIENVRVLIVEDEPYMAEAIRDGLRLEAIAADTAGDGDTALELLSVNAYDIAVLDRDVPGPSGDQIAQRIVASGSGMPILMLTAADRLDDKASGFGLGADDYLTKPFEMRELVLRLRALDRRRAHNRPPVRELAGLRLDPFRREVYRDGRYVPLTRKQFAVLEVLVGSEGGVISAEELLERAWDENADPFTNAVRITVSALRKRLGEPWLIATVPGVGYRIDTRHGARSEKAEHG
jgi:two-component system, OmpR family, response regulator VanR